MHLPPALHMCFTAAHTPETARQLVQDISECARELQDGGVPGKVRHRSAEGWSQHSHRPPLSSLLIDGVDGWHCCVLLLLRGSG